MTRLLGNTARLSALAVVLLSGCAGGGTRDGMVYRDGSWYSPAGEGRGDYYTASPRSQQPVDYPFGFDIGIVPFGGYCPVRYRYCTSFWPDAYFFGPLYDPYYDPLALYYRAPRPHRPPPRPRMADYEPGVNAPMPIPNRNSTPRPQAQPWGERPSNGRGDVDSGRGHRREGMSGGGSE